MTTSHGGRNGRGVSLNLVSRCHSHNPSVVDNYDEHMEEDIAKAMAEFVETDIADNSPVTSTNTTNTSVVEMISGSTQSLDMVATSTSTSASSASWMHAQSSQVKESDNRSHNTDAITTALLSSIAASCAPSTTAITSHSQSYTLLSSSVDQLKSTPSTVDSSLLGQNNDGLMNTGTSIVSPTSQHNNNNNNSNNNDQSEGTSKTRLFSNSLDLSTITAEQLKEELSLHTLIRLEQEVVKAIQLHGRTHHGEAMDTSQLSARTTNTTLPLAPTNANVPRGRGNGKRTMIPHRHANNGMDTSTNTSTSSMSVSSAGMAASYAKPDIPLVRLLPAPLPVSKSTNYTTGNNQAYRNLKLVTPIVSSPSGLASSSSSATMPMSGSNGILSHNSHSDTSVPTRSELAGMDRSKSMSRIPTSTMIHRRIVSPSSMSQSTPILLPSASSYTGISTSASLTNGLMVTSTDMKRIAKRKSELVNSEGDQSLSQPLRARRRLTKSTSDISTVTAKHTNTTTTESVNIISKSLPTITEVPSNSGKGVQRQQNNSNNNNNSNGNGRNNRVIAPSPPATPLGPSIVPPPVGDPHPPRALPATQPITRVVDGVEWIEFSYSVKGANQYYRMRADIDTVDLDAVPIRFKHDNCLYPRADVPLDEYRGNRWRYENECNNLGWRLAWLNREVMSGKRGLLQRAVDSYRNRYRTMRSRRVARLEKMASSSNSSINNGSNSNHGNHGEGNDGTIRKPRKKSTSAMTTTTTTTTSSDTKDQHGMKPLINDTTTLNSPTITSSLPLTSVSDIIGTTSLEQLSSHLLIPNTSVEAPSLMNDSLLTQSMASLTAGVLSSDSPMLLANTGTTAMTPTTATESSNIDWSAARSRSARMPKYLVFDAVIKGMSTRVRIRVDPTQKEDVLKHTDDEFRRANALYPRALCPREQYTGMRYDLETRCNQLAFELAALNPARLNGRKALLQKAVDAYRKRFAFDWRPRRGKTALLVRVAAEAAAAVAQQQSPIASKIQLPDTACLSGGSSSSSCNVKEDHSCDTTLPLMSVTPVSTPEPSSLTTVVDMNVMTKTTSTDMTSATIGESTLPGGLDYLQLPTDNAHFESLVLSEVQMLTQKLNSSMSASNVNSVAISPTPSGCLSTNEAQLQALLMDDEHELHDSHNEALLVKQLEEALQRSTQHNQQSHHDSSSGNNSHMSTTVSTPNASNYHQHQHQHHITEHALSAVDLIHALQHQ